MNRVLNGEDICEKDECIHAKTKKTKIKITFIIYIFCLIFAPPILPGVNFFIVVSLFSLYKITMKYKNYVGKVIYNSKMHEFSGLLLFAIIYILWTMGLNIFFSGDTFWTNYAITIYRLSILIPLQLVCVTYVICRSRELGYGLKELLLTLIWAGVIQAAIGIGALIYPQFKLLLINIMSHNIGTEIFYRGGGDKFRYFGFSATLLDTFGYGTGILFALSIFLAFKEKSKYLFFALILIVPPTLNSRTGLIIGGLGVIMAIPVLLDNNKIKHNMRVLINVILIIFMGIVGLAILNKISPNTVTWISRGLGSILSFFTGKETEYFEIKDVLFSDRFWTLPEGLRLIFGSGHTAYGIEELGFHSDVGYVNHLWLGGVIGTIFLYLPFIKLYWTAFKASCSNMSKWLVVFLSIAFFVGLIKGDLISYNSGSIITLIICFFIIYTKNSEIRITGGSVCQDYL